MDLQDENGISRVMITWRRYFPAINCIILAVPVLFYLLAVRPSAAELIYTFRISNTTDYFLYELRLDSGRQIQVCVPPGGESELFSKKIIRRAPDWFSNPVSTVSIRLYSDSVEDLQDKTFIIRFDQSISPNRLNRICITAESLISQEARIQ
jgi:hypothetical protein